MVRAAYDLFCEAGYAATTMDAIAREAGVAVQTLYFTFGTKAAILSEALGAAITGFDDWMGEPPEPFDTAEAVKDILPWYRRFEAEPDPRRALAIFVDHGFDALARVAPLVRVLHAVAGHREAEAVFEIAERRRHETFRELVRVLADKGGLRRGVSLARATDIVLVIFSAETYYALSTMRGWSAAACRRWFVDVLSQQILP